MRYYRHKRSISAAGAAGKLLWARAGRESVKSYCSRNAMSTIVIENHRNQREMAKASELAWKYYASAPRRSASAEQQAAMSLFLCGIATYAARRNSAAGVLTCHRSQRNIPQLSSKRLGS